MRAGLGDGSMIPRKVVRVPLHVLGAVHQRQGLGYEWSCNYKGCAEHGYRIGREVAWDAVAMHWRERHRAQGGSRNG